MVVLSQGDSFVLFSNSRNDCERYYAEAGLLFRNQIIRDSL